MTPLWTLNIAGLCFGAIAAVMMFYFPRHRAEYTSDGRLLTQFVDEPTATGNRIARRRAICSAIAPWLLALAFVLQLLAALPSAGR